MRNTIFGRRGLPWALAAVLVVSMPVTRSVRAAASGSPSSMIQAELPSGVTMRRATADQMVAAVQAAVKANPAEATSIVQAAIMARRHERDGKDHDPKDGADCPYVRRVARAAIASAPDRASDITQMALSLAPDCADSLNSVAANSNDPNDPNNTGYNSPDDLYGGFGAGFGPGFPGSPGFTGSPPSGAIALPPVAVTSTVNG